MRVVFMGTSYFALESLQALVSKHEVLAVYTKEPKVSGRGQDVLKSPVHIWAEKNSIEVRTPKTLRNEKAQEDFLALNADIAVVAAYGLILPTPVLYAFPNGCVNIHGSLLPRWRGAAPIQRCIEAGDRLTGITTMKMNEGLDTGDMLLKATVEIFPETTGGELYETLSTLGAELILKTLDTWDSLKPIAQDDNFACYAPKLEKSESLINFNMDAESLTHKIMAFSPYPAVYFEHNGERFKLLSAKVAEDVVEKGKIEQRGKRLLVGCGRGAVEVLEIQRQGKARMMVSDFLRGFSF